jgi:hypothetical protein
MATSNKISSAANGPTTLSDEVAAFRSDVEETLEQIQAELDETREEVEAIHQDVLYGEADRDAAWTEQWKWPLDLDPSPAGLIKALKRWRIDGYQTWGVHAEPLNEDPEIVEAERCLYDLVSAPIRPHAVARNRSEFEVWVYMWLSFPRDSLLPKKELLDRASAVLFAGSEAIPADPTERIWPALAANNKLREQLHHGRGLRSNKTTKASGTKGARKRTTKKVSP